MLTVTTRRRLGEVAEIVVVAVTVASLTLGPVYQFRLRWPTTVDLAVDPVVVTWLMAMHIAPLGFVASRWASVGTRVCKLGAACAVTLCALLVASTLWSEVPSTTGRVAIQVAATALTGIYLVGSVDVRIRIYGLVAGLHAGLVWSAWRIRQDVPGSLDAAGNWVGVFFNRNSLAPVAVLGAACCVLVLIGLRELVSGRLARIAVAGGAVALAVLDARLFVGTGSRSSGVAVVIAAVVVGILLVARRLVTGLPVPRLQVMVGGGLVVVAGLGSALLSLFTSPGDLTGRTAIWGVVVDWWVKRPLQGWGYLSMWGTNVQFSLDQYVANDGVAASSAHNSFFDVLLGGGVAAAAAFVGLVVAGWVVVSRSVLTSRSVLVLVPAVTWVFCVVLNAVETLVIGNMLFWALLAGGIVAPADLDEH